MDVEDVDDTVFDDSLRGGLLRELLFKISGLGSNVELSDSFDVPLDSESVDTESLKDLDA